MQFKLVPPAPDELAYVETVRTAVPLVPGTETDCCARIMDRTDVSPRDEARTWLTFLRALGCVEKGPSGFTRTRQDLDVESIREAFRDQLYGVEDLLDILETADGPLSSDEVFDRFQSSIPAYEQYRYGDRLEGVWSERVERLLEWGVVLDLVDRSERGYTVH